ncbi:MAG: tRNA (adenosine(37)-N6)-threonylcarbamoyltransferase complex ATPase subunit type 1 TsaE [Thermoanaerobaculia bacterium]|jgi:tRNA threonylcarbamoyladenosine biosynthesis protein TsaE
MRRWTTSSEEETRQLGVALGGELVPDGILLLSGELGVGKTVLAQGVAAAVGVPAREVQSPSFILVREHEGSTGRFTHIDLYRLEPEETEVLGMAEILAGEGVKVVEWAERLPCPPASALHILIRVGGVGDEREIVATRLDQLNQTVEGSAR